MNLKQLRYFLEVAQEKQITAAARNLHIAQPPLSYQLKELEKDLDAQLFVRNSKGITLTEAGEALAGYAQEILELSDYAKDKVKQIDQGRQGTISLGIISSSGNQVPGPRLQEFQEFYPEVNFEIYESNTFGVLDYLKRRKIDLGIVRTPFNFQGVASKYFAKEKMVAVLPPQIKESKKHYQIEDVAKKPLLIYRRFAKIFADSFSAYGLKPFIAMTCDDARTTIRWAEMGMGVALVPASIAALETKCQIIEIDYEPWQTQMALIWLEEVELTPLLKNFIEKLEG